LEDPAVAGRLMQGAVEQAEAHIEGPWWHIDLDNPARVQACKEAAQDARRKAEAYAEALGLRLGAVRSVSEAVTTPWSRGGTMLAMAERSTAAAEIGIDAGELDVSASVTITFGIDR
jgi:uncharacterized protein